MSKKPDDLSLTEIGAAVYRMHLSGNLIPKSWLKHIRMPSGNPDAMACYILSEIVYWYRPNEIANAEGMTIRLERRFWGDKLQLHYKAIADSFGISVSHAKQIMYRLIEFGVLERELRTVDIGGTPIGNVPFWSLNIEKLYEITYTTPTPPCDQPIARVRSADGEGTTDESQGYYALIAYTKSTSESTSEKTPNSDFSFSDQTATATAQPDDPDLSQLVTQADLDQQLTDEQALEQLVAGLDGQVASRQTQNFTANTMLDDWMKIIGYTTIYGVQPPSASGSEEVGHPKIGGAASVATKPRKAAQTPVQRTGRNNGIDTPTTPPQAQVVARKSPDKKTYG